MATAAPAKHKPYVVEKKNRAAHLLGKIIHAVKEKIAPIVLCLETPVQ
jgi:hypothetical protein